MAALKRRRAAFSLRMLSRKIDGCPALGYIADMKKSIVLTLCLLVVSITLNFSSCSSSQQIMLDSRGGGQVEAELVLHPYFVAYLDDIVAGFSGAETGSLPLFDLELLADEMDAVDGVRLEKVENPQRERLHLLFSFQDPEKLFADASPRPYHFSVDADGIKTAQFVLSTETWPAVRSFVPMSQDQGVETFGPQDPPYSEPEYKDMLSFLLEEYAEASEIEAMIDSRRVDIRLQVEGEILSVRGFDSFSGDTALVRLPLLDLLTLSDPVRFSLRWR